MSFPARVERWRPYVERHLPDVPTDFVLAWIQHESDGNPVAWSKLGERGILQIHPDEAESMGLPDEEFAELVRLESSPRFDMDEHMRISSKLVLYKRDRARAILAQYGMTLGERDFWTLVKLLHGLPVIVTQGLRDFSSARRRAPESWNEFAAWLRNTSWSYGSWTAERVQQILTNAESVGRFVAGGGLGALLSTVLTVAAAWWLAQKM